MWNLLRIEARNICSLNKMKYDVEQNVATLIFGNNEDDGENQKHNGSGKSSFMECIAFGLTGEAFRKVDTIEDIINDDEDFAEVKLELNNQETGSSIVISRRIERGQSQKVELTFDDTDIPFVSVQDMNSRIYEYLGISKDDLYQNYILNNARFKSFFNSTDKEKKEIINTFSNGIIVDEAIEKLKADIEDLQSSQVDPAQQRVSRLDGAIEAIKSQITEAENSQESEAADRTAKIEDLKIKIADKRAASRENREKANQLKDEIEAIDERGAIIEDYGKQEFSLADLNGRIHDQLKNCGLEGLFSDWKAKIEGFNYVKESLLAKSKSVSQAFSTVKAKLEKSEADLKAAGKEYDELKAKNAKKNEADDKEIAEIQEEIKEYEAKIDKLNGEMAGINEEKANISHSLIKLNASIRGAVECPACHHKFILNSDLSIDEMKDKVKTGEADITRLEKDIDAKMNERKDSEKEVENCRLDMQDIRDDIQKRADNLGELFKKGQAFRIAYNGCKDEYDKMERELNDIKADITKAENEISRAGESMINEALNIIDDKIDILEREKKACLSYVDVCKSSIEVYEKSIAELENVSVSDHIEKLQASLKEKEAEKTEADDVLARSVSQLNELKEQVVRFTSFKTHLANTKINSIAQITNNILKEIKSPIRVHLSGYTMTKTGKMRDKISISVTRNGIDCGSFLKCSAGEKARIVFANIVAMQRMTNLTSKTGGLNLICIDEVLDHCEEAGLMSVAEIANTLGITVFMITQGKTTESYPHQITVTKSLGRSHINSNNRKDENNQ